MMEGVYNFSTWDMEDFGRLLHEKGGSNVTWKRSKDEKKNDTMKKRTKAYERGWSLDFYFLTLMASHMNSFTPKNNNVLLLNWGQTMSQVLKVPIIGFKIF
jgi:hypothetical protein